jgi:hypothetical protein
MVMLHARCVIYGPQIVATDPTSRFLEMALDSCAPDSVSSHPGRLLPRCRTKGKADNRHWLLLDIYASDAKGVQMHIGSVILVIWLVIGGIAAGQRGDYKGPVDCSRATTTAVTILAGPLNYAGVNLNINCSVQHTSN